MGPGGAVGGGERTVIGAVAFGSTDLGTSSRARTFQRTLVIEPSPLGDDWAGISSPTPSWTSWPGSSVTRLRSSLAATTSSAVVRRRSVSHLPSLESYSLTRYSYSLEQTSSTVARSTVTRSAGVRASLALTVSPSR